MSFESAPYSFLTTRWSVVHRAASKNDPDAQAALAHLCAVCWFPIYAYIRRTGKSSHDAEDLTQGFFARLLEKKFPRFRRWQQRPAAHVPPHLRPALSRRRA